MDFDVFARTERMKFYAIFYRLLIESSQIDSYTNKLTVDQRFKFDSNFLSPRRLKIDLMID